ncbi:restriction endonuclease subunit S [Pseudomonas sp. WS 5018]|uniref:restriction endonuclease subunit S n=1 Tax=Stutzerimonas stutzeri TaxID=316 RepID=UPI000DABC187|nr:restriction endonuclease subunit S [Stutzerimonas stutzeri]NMY64452.1 restriction endonuclease subunit S [Pseudomonas sp. WS 5018]MDH1554228.1 restriction endonuclease subunit S [Stutzerimonas stutzeri]RAA00623.1 restriction endonuclease subunit S [Stutzerimonas stutzeri]TGY10069.1 restriction endonuclease subunit S [Stutzerimonas stutzeri]GBC55576.1 type I restriction-modification system, specificity subunit S [Stutzerimonas stutzeri]
MSFPTYPAYKDSGVKWLSDVPEHWDVRRNKQVFRLVSVQVGNKSADFQLLSLTLRGVIPRDMESGKGKFPAEFDTYQVVEPDDIVFCLFDIDETPRTVGISSDLGMITGAYTVAKTLPAADPRFIYYYYFSIDLRKGLRPFYTGLRKVVRPETFLNIELPLPPLSEQANICNFLDHETARIDALIEEQQRLIELLKEKRQAVISHAVTKGLDPTVPMKDSGVEWLGDVPAHWVVSKIGFRARLQGGFAFSADMFTTVGVPVVKMNNLKRGVLELSEAAYVGEEFCDERFALHVGDVLFGMSGSIGPTGSLGNYAVVSEYDIPAMLNQRVGRFVLNSEEVHPGFMTCVLCSRHFNEQVQLLVTGTAQFNISSEQVESCLSVFPPAHEQAQIAHFLEQETSRFDTLLSEAENGIGLLNERRSALISAAVTGKIDVRGWQPPASTQAPKLAVAEAV